MKRRGKALAGLALAGALAGAGGAEAASYAIDWTGENDWTMTGRFSFADALLGSLVTFAELDDLAIAVFEAGTPMGARSLAVDGPGSHTAAFNFNFDSATGLFRVGGASDGPTGQEWFSSNGGAECDTIGFSSGSWAQGLCIEGRNFVDEAYVVGRSTLTATRLPDPPGVAPGVVPLPASLPLLAGGLLGLAVLGWRRGT